MVGQLERAEVWGLLRDLSKEKVDDMMLIFKVGDPDETFRSHYGILTYRGWLMVEQERIAVKGRVAEVITLGNGRVGLAVNRLFEDA